MRAGKHTYTHAHARDYVFCNGNTHDWCSGDQNDGSRICRPASGIAAVASYVCSPCRCCRGSEIDTGLPSVPTGKVSAPAKSAEELELEQLQAEMAL
jgi:hypothetical protein